MGDSKDVLFDALNAESEELDTLLWTTPTTIGGLFALLELWEEIMKTRPDTLFSDYNEAQISSVTQVLRDLHPNA